MSTTDWGTQDEDVQTPLHCANHPNVETYVRCSKCEKPICAKCRVRTPVGFRCFDCARLQSLPTYAVSTDYYVKASVAGLVAAGVAGILMGLFPAFEFWAALLMAIAVPEAISVASNQKRGQGLQMVGMACVAFGFILSRVVMRTFPLLIPLGGTNIPGPSGIGFLDNLPFYFTQYTILWLALALLLTSRRLR